MVQVEEQKQEIEDICQLLSWTVQGFKIKEKKTAYFYRLKFSDFSVKHKY